MNTPFVVGEKGPEIFIPPSAGRLLPSPVAAGALRGGGGGVTIVPEQLAA